MLLMTSTKLSVLQTFGKITKGSTLVDSVTVLNAVNAIHAKGTSIVMLTALKIAWINTLIIFPLRSIFLPPFHSLICLFLIVYILSFCYF